MVRQDGTRDGGTRCGEGCQTCFERLLPVKTMVESDDSDYRFRAYLDRDTVAGTIAGHVAAIDYEHGFKDRTLDRRRLPYLYSVGEIMATMQDDLHSD